MSKFRKKPVIVEAKQLTHYYDDATHEYVMGNIKEVVDWINSGLPSVGEAYIDYDPSGEFGIKVVTLEGVMYAGPRDWIIRGVQGEFYPCKPDIFEETYEPVTDA
jgi:hypothetical protein